MEEQFSSLSRVPPFWYETSIGSKPANRVMAKYPATLPCKCNSITVEFGNSEDLIPKLVEKLQKSQYAS